MALTKFPVLFFMAMFGLTQHIHDELVMHLDQLIQQYLAGFQKKTDHHGIALLLIKALNLFGIVTPG